VNISDQGILDRSVPCAEAISRHTGHVLIAQRKSFCFLNKRLKVRVLLGTLL
jgi:hypothetical protein